jgi:eukaryotic-like serine/threonine-protein kinase
MGLKPGYFVTKQVQIVRLLKRGGMGSVWIADHLGLKTQVAVKFMSAKVADDPSMVTRFNREATSCAQIKSPHVVQVHDHGVTADGDPYIVMELLEGEDLATVLRKKETLSLEQIGAIVQQMGKVLRRAHTLEIIHRDIKPSNIFLVESGDELFIKLLDFGVAKMGTEESDITSTGATVGTMVYMAPEQLLSARRVDHRADLWSVAVVVYRAITGELPFRDEDGVGALIRALEMAVFRPPSALVEGLPPEVDAWFAKSFQRDPAARYQGAREQAEEFLAAIGKTTPTAAASQPSHVSPLKRIKKMVNEGPTAVNQPISATGASAAALAAVAAPRASITQLDPPREEAPEGVQAETLAGTASLPAIAGLRRTRRWPFFLVAVVVLAGLAGAALYVVAPERLGISRARPRLAATAAPSDTSAPTSAAPPPAVTHAPSASATEAPSAAEPPPSASATTVAAPTASGKWPRQGGQVRGGNRNNEKDYGF